MPTGRHVRVKYYRLQVFMVVLLLVSDVASKVQAQSLAEQAEAAAKAAARAQARLEAAEKLKAGENTKVAAQEDAEELAAEEQLAKEPPAREEQEVGDENDLDDLDDEDYGEFLKNETIGGITVYCEDGLLLQAWRPSTNLDTFQIVVRGVVYFLTLMYLFIGVAILSDYFMAGIEVITSSERRVVLKKPNGEKYTIMVRVWNDTVANLTLMAMGSSAPEILLSLIELFQKKFESGDLGPCTVVGSGAYNLFIIVSICILVVPKGEVRKIKHLRVFIVTAFWSTFAFIWLYLIVTQISPGRIEPWEGLVTLFLFPVTVLHAYCANAYKLCYKGMKKTYSISGRGTVVERAGPRFERESDYDRTSSQAFEDTRKDFITALKDLRAKHPESDLETLERLALDQSLRMGPKSRAFYRIHATRKLLGGGGVTRKSRAFLDADDNRLSLAPIDDDMTDSDSVVRIFFKPAHYTVMESCGKFEVKVVRKGDLSSKITIEYFTEDGTAKAGKDYVPKEGVLVFHPGVELQTFKVEIIENDFFEQDVVFNIFLASSTLPDPLVVPKIASIMILDDDHCGIFKFAEKILSTPESVAVLEIAVNRLYGALGRVAVPYWTENGTALAGKHYVQAKGQLVFDRYETEKKIQVKIINESQYEKDVVFIVKLGQPSLTTEGRWKEKLENAEKTNPLELTAKQKILLRGKPKLGSTNTAITVHIVESEDFKSAVEKLVHRANAAVLVGTSSWKEQFMGALTVSKGADDFEDEDEDEWEGKDIPTTCEYAMHFISLFWKVVFAFVPPSNLFDGYLCFFIAMALLGLITAFLADIASHFGCTLGILDAITAIFLVAVGTSLPDTFASKIAAQHDDTADNSIGNVTGSNAVNVFLGIGIAWSLASLYHWWHGEDFVVPEGTLTFSTVLFLCLAIVALALIVSRRRPSIGGELGGPTATKWCHAMILIMFYATYLTISTLKAYGLITGF